jgi:hypothetical protein
LVCHIEGRTDAKRVYHRVLRILLDKKGKITGGQRIFHDEYIHVLDLRLPLRCG